MRRRSQGNVEACRAGAIGDAIRRFHVPLGRRESIEPPSWVRRNIAGELRPRTPRRPTLRHRGCGSDRNIRYAQLASLPAVRSSAFRPPHPITDIPVTCGATVAYRSPAFGTRRFNTEEAVISGQRLRGLRAHPLHGAAHSPLTARGAWQLPAFRRDSAFGAGPTPKRKAAQTIRW